MPVSYSPLRYPGGKAKIYKLIKRVLEVNGLIGETYIEPFAGGAGLALKLLIEGDVKRIVINDLDPAIYSMWYSILNYTDEFCDLIEHTPITTEQWIIQKEIYNRLDIENKLLLGFATFYLNRTNVSGVIKGGIIGGQNQAGAYKIDARYKKENLIMRIRKIAKLKKKIILLNIDAKEMLTPKYLNKYKKVLINADPPYVKKGSQLYKNAFVENDHCELADIIKKCNRKWIVTYDICPLVTELYDKQRKGFLNLTYSVKGNRKAQEYIFFSNNIVVPEEIKLLE